MSIEPCLVGAWNNTSLPKDAIFTSWHTNRFARWKYDLGEACEKQTEANHDGTRREISQGVESC